jgi:hypothetical protein
MQCTRKFSFLFQSSKKIASRPLERIDLEMMSIFLDRTRIGTMAMSTANVFAGYRKNTFHFSMQKKFLNFSKT